MTRGEWWSAIVQDRDGVILDDLPRITGGSLEWNAFAAVQSGGQLDFTQAPTQQVDWATARIQVRHHSPTGQVQPVGVYLPSWPGRRHTPERVTATVRLESPTARLRSQIGTWLQYGPGHVVTPQIVATLQELGETQIAITPSGEHLRTPMAWEPDVTWGRVVADILDAAGYGTIWCDANGWWRAAPYRPPADRPLTATYGGSIGDYRVRADYGDEAEMLDIPNRVFVYTRASADTPALTATAEITDPSHPRHHSRVGRFTRAESVEATSQDVVDAKARRLLAEGLEVSRYIEWTHPVDDTQLGDRVQIRRLATDVVITARRITLGIGAVVESRGRHIYTGGRPWL